MSRRGPIIVAIVGVLLIVLTVVGLILPKLNDIRATQQKTAVAAQQQQKLELTLSALQSTQKQAAQLRKALQRYGIEVPPNADLPGLIRDMTGAAGHSAVTLQTISPAPPSSASAPAVSIIPLQITVSGGYFAVDEFLYRLERMARVSTVTSVSITPSASTTTTTTTSSSSTFPLTAPSLSAVITANFFTMDTSSGPGSKPGSQEPPVPSTGSGSTGSSTGGSGTTGGSSSTTTSSTS